MKIALLSIILISTGNITVFANEYQPGFSSTRTCTKCFAMLIHLTLGLLIATISSCLQPVQLSVHEILDQVEKANISSVTATVSYTRTDPILDRRDIRKGTILLRIK